MRVVDSFLDHLAVERGSAVNTLLSYRRDLNRYLGYLDGIGVTSIDGVSALTVSGFLAYLREGDSDHVPLSATSAARGVIAVRGLHRFALRERLVDIDVAHNVHPPAPARRLPKAITIDHVEQLINAAGIDQTPLAVRDRALIEMLYGTGARISEAVGLAVDDVDLDALIVQLSGKGGKQRRVPLGTYAARAIEAYLVRVRPGLAVRWTWHPETLLECAGRTAVASVGLDGDADGG